MQRICFVYFPCLLFFFAYGTFMRIGTEILKQYRFSPSLNNSLPRSVWLLHACLYCCSKDRNQLENIESNIKSLTFTKQWCIFCLSHKLDLTSTLNLFVPHHQPQRSIPQTTLLLQAVWTQRPHRFWLIFSVITGSLILSQHQSCVHSLRKGIGPTGWLGVKQDWEHFRLVVWSPCHPFFAGYATGCLRTRQYFSTLWVDGIADFF